MYKENITDKDWKKYMIAEWTPLKDGEPCWHKGCLNHISHPCEKCGRIAGSSKLTREFYENRDKQND